MAAPMHESVEREMGKKYKRLVTEARRRARRAANKRTTNPSHHVRRR